MHFEIFVALQNKLNVPESQSFYNHLLALNKTKDYFYDVMEKKL